MDHFVHVRPNLEYDDNPIQHRDFSMYFSYSMDKKTKLME